MFKIKFIALMSCLLLFHSYSVLAHHNGDDPATGGHKTKKHKAKQTVEDNSIFITASGSMLCNVNISSSESREIVIMKMQQRMDCLEAKVNELGKQLGNALVNNSLTIEK